jgi:class 3 adenylate cyclase
VVAGDSQRIDTATVLFTDLVGSTALRSRIGEEAADRLRVEHDALVHGAIVANRGAVVKHTGDGAMATFSAAVDAVAAAVAIQQAVDGHNRRSADERMEVRVGISVGDVTFTDADCFGLPVIEAQRLEAAAEGGQILCADIVRHLARGRGGHEFVSVGDLELKGITEAVPAVAVQWEPIEHVAMPRETPLPPVLASPSTFDLSGRSAELSMLVDAWKQSAEGQRKVVLVSGEPGIGKTRLATEAALVARHHGALVIGGRCDDELALPYQPFAEALRFQSELDVPTAWLGPAPGDLLRLAPELSERVPGLTAPAPDAPEADRARLFDAVTSWVRSTAASVPLFLVLDDLHWADRPTLLLLRHLLHETPHDALFVVGTYRSTDLDRTHPLSAMLADLRRDGAVTRLALDGLTEDGVAELLERAAGHALDEAGVELATAIYRETSGNPFFVGEIVRHLVESGALFVRDGRWTSDLTLADVGLPEGVREVVGRRISRLDGDTQKLLTNAAVIGHEFTLPVLAAVAGFDEDGTVDLLDIARRASLVNEVGLDRYRFGHALVRATLLEELTTTRRVRTHRKVAEVIEAQHARDVDAVVTELAFHYGEAAAADPDKAIEYAKRAGEQAYAQSAADDAVRWYGLALEHLDAEADDGAASIALRVEIMTQLARAEYTAGTANARDRARDAARLAKAAGLDLAMADALLVHVRTSFDEQQESDPEKIELLEEVIPRVDDPGLRARLMAMLAVELIYVGDPRRASLLEQAAELAAGAGDPVAVREVLSGRFNAYPRTMMDADELRRYRSQMAQLRAIVERDGDAGRRGAFDLQGMFLEISLGDGEAMRHHARGLAELYATTRNASVFRMLLLVDQMFATIEGRLVEADALSVELFTNWRRAGMPEAFTYRATTSLGSGRELGRLAAVLPGWQSFVDARPGALSSAATAAFISTELGDLDQAAIWFEKATPGGITSMPPDAGWPMGMAFLAEVAAVLADRAAAEELHATLSPFDGLICGTGGICCGPGARLLARLEVVLDRPDDADRHFADAVAQARNLASPVWEARGLLDWADALVARGDEAGATTHADAADAAIGSLTLPRLQRQADALRARI